MQIYNNVQFNESSNLNAPKQISPNKWLNMSVNHLSHF